MKAPDITGLRMTESNTMPLEMTAQQPINLLIVDDLADNLDALEAIIKGEGRVIFRAKSGAAALDLLLEHEFALAILDVQMPNMNGFELAELMRGAKKTRGIPIIFVTAAIIDKVYSFKGYEQGAVDFLHKPLDIQALKSKVNVFVALRVQQNLIQSQLSALEKSEAALKAAREELQIMVQMRDEFMSLVAHELRTPLNTLLLDSQVRQKQLANQSLNGMDSGQLKTMLDRNQRQYNSMVRLIDDMLDVTRIRNGKLSIKHAETCLTDLVQNIFEVFTPIAQASNTTISLKNQPNVYGVWDGFRVEQIIVNLITNALRYGEGEPVEIIMTATAKDAFIEVVDHGIGISAEDQKRIFEPFERASQQISGIGLGLYIAKQLALAHDGDLEVESVVGEFTRFKFSMPLNIQG